MPQNVAIRDKLVLLADPAEIARLIEWIDQFEDRCALPPRTAYAIRLSLEEIALNVLCYAYEPGSAGTVEIGVCCRGQTIAFTVRDTGRPFNPLTEMPPPVPTSLEEAPIGGVGIALVRHFASRLTYERDGDYNVLSLIFDAASPGDPITR